MFRNLWTSSGPLQSHTLNSKSVGSFCIYLFTVQSGSNFTCGDEIVKCSQLNES